MVGELRARAAARAHALGAQEAGQDLLGHDLEQLELAGPATFVLGAERDGLPAGILASCDEVATIRIASGSESLNVAAAGAIALYEWRRQRTGGRDG